MDEHHKQKKEKIPKCGEGAGRARQSAAPAVSSGPPGPASVSLMVEAASLTPSPVLTPVGRLPRGEPGIPIPAASTASTGPAKGSGPMGPAGTKPQQGSPEPEALAPALGTLAAAGPGKDGATGIRDVPTQPGDLTGGTSTSPEVLAGPGWSGPCAVQPRELPPGEPRAELAFPPSSSRSPHLSRPPSVSGWTGLAEPAAVAVSLDAPRSCAVDPRGRLTVRHSAGRIAVVTPVAEPVARRQPKAKTSPTFGLLTECHRVPPGVCDLGVAEPAVLTGSGTSVMDRTAVALDTGAGESRTPWDPDSLTIAGAHQAPSSR
jgi:hypothetical protein